MDSLNRSSIATSAKLLRTVCLSFPKCINPGRRQPVTRGAGVSPHLCGQQELADTFAGGQEGLVARFSMAGWQQLWASTSYLCTNKTLLVSTEGCVS